MHIGAIIGDFLLTVIVKLTGVFILFFLLEGEKLDNIMKGLETQYNSLQVLSTITKLGTKEVHSSINVVFVCVCWAYYP